MTKRLDSKRKRYILSLLMTMLIVLVLLYPTTTATAISVTIEGLQGVSITQGDTKAFNIDLTIENGERVPVSTVRLVLVFPDDTSETYEFPVTGGVDTYLELDEPQAIVDSSAYDYGYGYGYGSFFGYGYISGYGYGYYPEGYGYGFYGSQKLRWIARLINTENLPEGNYKVRVEVQSNGVWWGGAPTETTFSVKLYVPPGPAPGPAPPPVEEPDLEPTSIEVIPSVPTEEQECTVKVTVNNTDTEDADAFNATLKADDVTVQTLLVDGLAADESVTLSFTWTPPDAATYELTATVDPEDAIDESDETNNDISLTVTAVPPPPLPDLTVEFVDLPDEFETEKTYEIKAIVRNIDGADAPRFSVRLEADDTGVQTLSVDSLAVDESITLAFRWTPPEPDTYELTVIVDPGNLIEELDETNNTDSATVTVKEKEVPPAPLPDLTVEFVDLPEEFVAGRTYGIEAQVRNIGEGDAETFNVELKANGASVQEIEVESLAAGADVTLAFTWTPGELFPGDYTLTVTVDPEDEVTEADETNNSATTEVTVSPKPREVIWYEQWGPIIAGAVTIVIIMIIALVITRQRR